MSARPYEPMDTSRYPSFGLSSPPPLPDSDDDELMSELDSILSGNEPPPMADAVQIDDNVQIAQAVPEYDFSNLSTEQIKKLVPYGQVLHLLGPSQIDILLGENQMNPLDGRAALTSRVTKRFSLPSTKKRFTITSSGKRVYW